MRPRLAWTIIAGVSVVALGATAIVGALALAVVQQRERAAPEVSTAVGAAWEDGDRLVFRSTAAGAGYGHVASVSLTDPAGPRAIGDAACDRVDATAAEFSCLRSVRGIVPTYTGTLYAHDGTPLDEWPLSGIPSRTRLSPDGALIATTAFVTGHSYATVGFSTETTIRSTRGAAPENIEEWTLLIDGEVSAPVDRNYWGVTFVDDTAFYATVGLSTTGATYLVRGDTRTRTLSTIASNVECPSLSPDGTRIAFKRVVGGAGPTVHWTPAIRDLATGEVTLLPESRSIDDQIEWLDDSTILYGMPRGDQPGDTDIWALRVDGSRSPALFVEHAWSPAVVRAER